MPKILLVLMLFVAFGDMALAQQSGTPEEQRACKRDVQRYCKKVIGEGDFSILACLQQNRAAISAACKEVLANHGQ